MRLLEHRTEHITNGRVGPLLRTEDLSEEEVAYIRELFVCRLTDFEGDITVSHMREAYVSVLADHGVMCPHPELSQTFRHGYQYCELCDCPVLRHR